MFKKKTRMYPSHVHTYTKAASYTKEEDKERRGYVNLCLKFIGLLFNSVWRFAVNSDLNSQFKWNLNESKLHHTNGYRENIFTHFSCFSFSEKYNTFVLHYSQVVCVMDSLGQ